MIIDDINVIIFCCIYNTYSFRATYNYINIILYKKAAYNSLQISQSNKIQWDLSKTNL